MQPESTRLPATRARIAPVCALQCLDVGIRDWLDRFIYPSSEYRRHATVAAWLLCGVLAGMIVLLPFIERRLFPPFGRYWPWNGTEPADSFAALLAEGFGLLTFVVAVIWLVHPNRRWRR